MARLIPCAETQTLGIDEYLAEISDRVDVNNEDSLAESAPLLRALANDRTLVVCQLNQMVERHFKAAALPSAQAILLGRGKDFFVRANIWPSSADIAAGRIYQENFSYDLAHDHNFSFMTAAYHGSGYETDLYECDPASFSGYAGEPVTLRVLKKVRFGSGMVMLYRAHKDVHVQHPPKDMSITLNLMVSTPGMRLREQHFFDLQRSAISSHPAESEGSRRVGFLRLAGLLGDGNSEQLLHDLLKSHPAPRTRLAAAEALCQLRPLGRMGIWELAASDDSEWVQRAARAALEREDA